MTTAIQLYNNILAKVKFIIKHLKLKLTNACTGRPFAMNPEDIIALGLFKQINGIPTKKAIWNIFEPLCSYKTLVVNLNRFSWHALLILKIILRWNQQHSHLIKHTDSTDIPVSLVKNAKYHKTMKGLASWGHSAKGWFYGLKLHLTSDLNRNVLNVQFTSGNASERKTFKTLNKDLTGLFVADAGYISKDLEKEFYIEHKRILFAKPRANMKKMITEFQKKLYDTRMIIELNFRNLKMFHSLETSLPRSVDGYLANYVYSLLAYVIQ
jgi:hypothetical protein